LNQFDAQPQIKAYLHYTLGITFSNLSDYPKAEEQLRSALAIARKGGSEDDLLWDETGLATVLTRAGKDWDEAEDLFRDALARVRKQGRSADPQLVHIATGDYAYLLWKKHGHSAQVVSLGTEATDLARASPAIPKTWLVIGDYEQAQYLMEENRDEEAAQRLAEALAIERSFTQPTSSLGPVLSTLGSLRAKHGDYAAAEQFQRQYRDETLRTLGPNHVFSIEALSLWAVTRSQLGHTDEALTETGKAVDTARGIFPPGSLGLWRPLVSRAYVLNIANQAKEAESLARESLECIRNTDPEDFQHADSWAELGIALLQQRKFQEAVSALQTSEQIYLKLPGWGPKHSATTRVRDALAAARAGRVHQ
jgi:tetratricopeptide (TPR) repeat protein